MTTSIKQVLWKSVKTLPHALFITDISCYISIMIDIEKIVKIIENNSPELAVEEILMFNINNRRELLIEFWMSVGILSKNRRIAEIAVDKFLNSIN